MLDLKHPGRAADGKNFQGFRNATGWRTQEIKTPGSVRRTVYIFGAQSKLDLHSRPDTDTYWSDISVVVCALKVVVHLAGAEQPASSSTAGPSSVATSTAGVTTCAVTYIFRGNLCKCLEASAAFRSGRLGPFRMLIMSVGKVYEFKASAMGSCLPSVFRFPQGHLQKEGGALPWRVCQDRLLLGQSRSRLRSWHCLVRRHHKVIRLPPAVQSRLHQDCARSCLRVLHGLIQRGHALRDRSSPAQSWASMDV